MKKDELSYSCNHVYREGYKDGYEDGLVAGEAIETAEEKTLRENSVLKERCYVYGKGLLCGFCSMECKHKEN